MSDLSHFSVAGDRRSILNSGVQSDGSWWERRDLTYRDGRLHFGDHDVATLARSANTPLYLYNGLRIRDNLLRLRAALDQTSLAYKIFYAMKANRHIPVLTYLKTLGLCGIDACSPNEVLLARQCGYLEEEISYTGTSVSQDDLRCLGRHPGVWVNCGSLSEIRRMGEISPGREIGIRVNPHHGTGYAANPLMRYSGAQTTKFGIYRERFLEAMALARSSGLRVTGLHFHTGCGYLTPQLPDWEEIVESSLWFLDRMPDARVVNVGGGLGMPLIEDDQPLDLAAWTGILSRQLGDRGVEIWIEPGGYLVKDAGVLVIQVNTVERKETTLFVGVNGGFNIHFDPAFYQLPLEPVPCVVMRSGDPRGSLPLRTVTIAGNINEALDLLAIDVQLPPIEEGDYLALLNAGAYGSSMSSNHCMRGEFSEYLLL